MKEHKLSNAELAILSLIAEKPRHGYEIEQVIEERGMREWTDVAFSSIYFILKGLVTKGLAVAALQPAAGRGPAKKVFQATEEGKHTLHQGIFLAIATAAHENQTFLLGLSCLPVLQPVEVEEAFNLRIASLENKIAEFSVHPSLTLPGFPHHIRAMFDYSITMIQAELHWSQSFFKSYLQGKK